MGILGTSPGTEPIVDGYLRGQVFNRDVAEKKKYLRIKIVCTGRRATFNIPNYRLDHVPNHVSTPPPPSFVWIPLNGELKPIRLDPIASSLMGETSELLPSPLYKSIDNFALNNWGGNSNYPYPTNPPSQSGWAQDADFILPVKTNAVLGDSCKSYYYAKDTSWYKTFIVDLSKTKKFSLIPFPYGIMDSLGVEAGWIRNTWPNIIYDQMSIEPLAASYTMSIVKSNSDKNEKNFNRYDSGQPIGYYQLNNLATFYSSSHNVGRPGNGQPRIGVYFVSDGFYTSYILIPLHNPMSFGVDCPIVLTWENNQPSIMVGSPRVDARQTPPFIGALQL